MPDKPTLIAWVIGIGLVVYVLITARWGWQIHKSPEPGPDIPPLTDNFGSADFAPQQTEPRGFTGMFFGKSSRPELKDTPLAENPGAAICSFPEHHVMIAARTRTGKGTRSILPALLCYGGPGGGSGGSMVIVDPKGENAAISSRARAAAGSRIQIINPWRVQEATFAALGLPPATFNPLDVLDRLDPNVVAIARSLASSISPSKGDREPFWKESAARLITAVLLWQTDHPMEIKTLRRLSQILTLGRKDFTAQYLAKMSISQAFGGAIRTLSAGFIDMADVTYSGIFANIGQATAFLSDPLILAATDGSSFRIDDLTTAPTSIYLVIPPDQMDLQRTWLRMVITAALQTIRRKRMPTDPRTLFLLDEFPALGRMDDMPSDIATMAGYGADFVLVIQGLDQLKAVYGDDHGALINNCAYKWFCNVSDLESAKYVSETLGMKTVRTVSKGESEGQTVGGQKPTEREGKSTNYGEAGRLLLQPNEVLNLGREVAILLAPNSLPHYLQPVDYWRLPEAFPNLFKNAPLRYDPNPTIPDSRGTDFPPQSFPSPAPGAQREGAYNWDQYAPKPEASQVLPSKAVPFDLTHYAPKPQSEAPENPVAETSGSSAYDPTRYAPPWAQNAPPQTPEKEEAKPPGWNYDPSVYAPKKPKGDEDP